MNKFIKRRDVAIDVQVCEHPLLDRIYRARQIKNPQQLDRWKSMLAPDLL